MIDKAATIEELLHEALSPTHLEVVDESHMHNVPKGAQSHFKVTVVSSDFEGKNLVARHRQINSLVDIQGRQIHALAIHAFSPSEWADQLGIDTESPECLGGSKA